MARGVQHTTFINAELLKRVARIQGHPIAIGRVDLDGRPYTQHIDVPETGGGLARAAIELLVDMAEAQQARDRRQAELTPAQEE